MLLAVSIDETKVSKERLYRIKRDGFLGYMKELLFLYKITNDRYMKEEITTNQIKELIEKTKDNSQKQLFIKQYLSFFNIEI